MKISWAAFVSAICLFFSVSNPGTAKIITGHVRHDSTLIPGARVRLQATPILTTSNQHGRFVLSGVPATDTLVITAWAEGYFNGDTHACPGDTGVVINLRPLYSDDNPSYQWIPPDADPKDPMRCGNCHTDYVMSSWSGNAHAGSAVNPFFLAMYYGTDIDGNPDIGVGYKRDFPNTFGNCATCHIPGAAVNNPWGVDPKSVSEVNKHGVFCDVCHKIYKVKPSTGQGTTGTLSIEFLRPPDGEQMFFGPFDDIHDPDAFLPLIKKSEFCAPCHTGKFWGVEAYNCFPEWQQSEYRTRGIECQSCHMAPDSVTTLFARPQVGGLERDPLTLPSHDQPGSRDPHILANSVTLQISARQQADSIVSRVVITNDQTGHHVPTGRPSRNMILLVSATHANGGNLEFFKGPTVPWWGGQGGESGDYGGMPGKGFAKILEDFEGNAPSPAWRPTHILSDNRIAAFVSDTSFYSFRAPPKADRITLSARLIYRRFFKDWMDEKRFDIPDILMENETLSLSPTPVTASPTGTPQSFWLGQNYPNPCNPRTTIPFKLDQPAHVKLTLYDALGQTVAVLADRLYSAGMHQLSFNASDLANGIYFYKISADDFHDIKKACVLK